jgi:hypothetical protein
MNKKYFVIGVVAVIAIALWGESQGFWELIPFVGEGSEK